MNETSDDMFDGNISRREFIQTAAAAGLTLAALGDATQNEVVAQIIKRVPAVKPAKPLQGLPGLDGTIVYEPASLELAATDQGGIVHRLPRAIVQPGSVDDVARIVRYANARRIPVAVRGRGHSAYGQTLVEGGIVIDSSTLDKVISVSAKAIEVEAGASLGTVVRAAFAAARLVPVIGGCSDLSVCGLMSVGGLGRGSFRRGAFVDQVIELQVVTGDGRLITCSDERERELFEMVLAGMGQCGIAVRVKLRLSPAPQQITSRTITYDSLDPFLADQERFAGNDHLDRLWTGIFPRGDGSWRYRTTVGRYGAADGDADPLSFLGDVSRGRISAPERRLYKDMIPTPPPVPASRWLIDAPAGALTGPKIVGRPGLCVYLPASTARQVMEPLLSSASKNNGISAIECVALNTNRFQRPLFRLPTEERIFSCWVLRTAYADSGPSLQEQVEMNAQFLERALAMGAVRYAPFGGMTTSADWRVHYGERLYRRFAAAKQRYDKRGILSLGAGIFS